MRNSIPVAPKSQRATMAGTRQPMSLWRRFLILALAWCCLLAAPPAAAQSQPPCKLSELFAPLQEAGPSEIGLCRGAELSDSNGDTMQVTSKGLLLWRKADNWTGFLGASRTLVLA